MTDKELFEKVEKEFYPEKSLRLERFNKTNFQKVLNEVKGPQAPQANVGGFLSRVAAAIPGTRGYRMRSAEARKQEALARQEELKAQQAEKDLKTGRRDHDEHFLKIYQNDVRFKNAYDKAAKNIALSSSEKDAYDAGMNKIDKSRAQEEKEKGKEEAFTKLGEELFVKLDDQVKGVASFLRQPENKNTKILFQKYILQNPPTTEEELNQLAGGLNKYFFDKQNRLRNREDGEKLTKFLNTQEKLNTPQLLKGQTLINAIGIKPQEEKDSKLNEKQRKAFEIVKKTAERFNRTTSEQLKIFNKESEKYKVDDEVNLKQGDKVFPGVYIVKARDKKTGTVIVKGAKKPGMKSEPKLLYRLPYSIVSLKQQEFPIEDDLFPESFAQIIKKYR